MTLIEGIGVGIGVGVVHTIVMLGVLFLARLNQSKREDETIELMRARNELDREKVDALKSLIPPGVVDSEDVEQFIRDLSWSSDASEVEKTIVAGNIRNFWTWIQTQ